MVAKANHGALDLNQERWEFVQHHLHKPRKGKAIGGVLHAVGKLAKKFKKKKVYPETEDLTHQVGPYVGDVGSEGKRRRAGPSAGKGKSPGSKGKGRRSWGDTTPGRPKAGPKARREQGRGGRKIVPDPRRKYPKPGERKIVPDPRRKYPKPGQPNIVQPAATGGRIGFKRFLASRVSKRKAGPPAPSRPKKTWPPKNSDLFRRYPKMPQPHKAGGDRRIHTYAKT